MKKSLEKENGKESRALFCPVSKIAPPHSNAFLLSSLASESGPYSCLESCFALAHFHFVQSRKRLHNRETNHCSGPTQCAIKQTYDFNNHETSFTPAYHKHYGETLCVPTVTARISSYSSNLTLNAVKEEDPLHDSTSQRNGLAPPLSPAL